MKRTAFFLSAAVLIGAFRPVMRGCACSMEAAASRPVAACRGAEMACCHRAAAPANRGCPMMAGCIVQEARIAVATLSDAPRAHEEVVTATTAASAAEASPFIALAFSPPPGCGSNQEGFLSASSLRGPPIPA